MFENTTLLHMETANLTTKLEGSAWIFGMFWPCARPKVLINKILKEGWLKWMP